MREADCVKGVILKWSFQTIPLPILLDNHASCDTLFKLGHNYRGLSQVGLFGKKLLAPADKQEGEICFGSAWQLVACSRR
jgi:hypothetical protein